MIMPFLALLAIFFVIAVTNRPKVTSASDSIFISHGSSYIDESGNGFYHVIENDEI